MNIRDLIKKWEDFKCDLTTDELIDLSTNELIEKFVNSDGYKPQSENGKIPIPHVSDSLLEPTMQELENMIDYINTQVASDQLDDFMDKAGKLNNFVKKYQRH